MWMWKRIAAVVVGGLVIVLGVLGQPSTARRIAYVVYAAGATLASFGTWLSYRKREEPLTWKPLAGWSALGGAAGGLVVGGVIDGLGAGLFIGLIYGGINGRFRKSRPDEDDEED